jgi:2-oxoacid:acceptor oxidoreductase gamma subunit (pyruvate/2-ketoisovalerate family)
MRLSWINPNTPDVTFKLFPQGMSNNNIYVIIERGAREVGNAAPLKWGKPLVIEIRFQGRGGQGAVVASEILGRALFDEGKYPQSFSVFGGERRGAPVRGYLRVDNKPILLKCQIKKPDHEIVFDLTLTEDLDSPSELKPDGIILVNTHLGIDAFEKIRSFKLGLVDASSIARSAGLGHTLNTAILGAYVRLTGLVRMQTMIETVRKMVPSKIDANIRALERGFETVHIYTPQEMH